MVNLILSMAALVLLMKQLQALTVYLTIILLVINSSKKSVLISITCLKCHGNLIHLVYPKDWLDSLKTWDSMPCSFQESTNNKRKN